jgi:hypothetical protein
MSGRWDCGAEILLLGSDDGDIAASREIGQSSAMGIVPLVLHVQLSVTDCGPAQGRFNASWISVVRLFTVACSMKQYDLNFMKI